MGKNYHIEGTITFYLNGEKGKTYSFNTVHTRNQIINKFLDDVKNLKYRVSIWWEISVEEDSIKPIPTHKKPATPVNIPIKTHNQHTHKYCQNNSRKYV